MHIRNVKAEEVMTGFLWLTGKPSEFQAKMRDLASEQDGGPERWLRG